MKAQQYARLVREFAPQIAKLAPRSEAEADAALKEISDRIKARRNELAAA